MGGCCRHFKKKNEVDLDETLVAIIEAEFGITDGDDDDDEPPPLSLWFPEWYVIKTWLDFKRHGIYPEAGGYNAQDTRLVDEDWSQVTIRYNRLLMQMEPELQALREDRLKSRRKRDAFDDLIAGDGDGAFEDLFG